MPLWKQGGILIFRLLWGKRPLNAFALNKSISNYKTEGLPVSKEAFCFIGVFWKSALKCFLVIDVDH
ncbi:hypothetical protein EFB08_16020 [Rufibacter latericius]|uniref:Uncharacterized protein n=1 Tax=Rufibacter latericius TaxID=2487040 RepID=A0A3M9ML85_9BACT|nr:hypothetical protein EFB08_16020 [Rufibacter latericius]